MAYDALIKALLDVDDKASPKLKAVQKELDNTTKSIGGMIKVGAVALGALALGGLVTSIKVAKDYADEIGKVAQKTGVATEAISGLKYAAELSDVSLEQLTTGLQMFSSYIGKVTEGNKDAVDTFNRLGISVTDVNGELKPTEQLFSDVAESISKLKDNANKIDLVKDIFGKAGPQLLPLLNQGAEGIRAIQREAERLGLIIKPEQAAAAEAFNDNITRINQSIRGILTTVATPFIQWLADITETYRKGVEQGSKWAALNRAILQGFLSIAPDFLGLPKAATELAFAEHKVAKAFQARLDVMKNIAAIEAKNPNDIRLASLRKQADELGKTLKLETAARNELLKADALDSVAKGALKNAYKPLTAAETERTKALGDQLKAQAKLNEEFDDTLLDLERQILGISQLSMVEQARWEAEHGNMRKYTEEQRQAYILWMQHTQAVLDAREEYKQIDNNTQQFFDNYITGLNNLRYESYYLTENLALLKNGMSDVALQSKQQADEMERQIKVRIGTIAQIIKMEQDVRAQLVKTDAAYKEIRMKTSEERERALYIEQQALGAHLKTLEGSRAVTEDIIAKNQEATREYEAWNELIGNAAKESQNLVFQWEMLNKWLKEGAIDIEQYDTAMQKLMESSNKFTDAQEQQTNEITEFWKSAAQSMQGAMSDFFFDVMQGNMSDLVGSFKRSIDRMVSDLLASQLMTYLMGSSFGKGGNIGGLVGSLFGGFRAAGGDVSAGTSYIVGEKGPELFTPTTSGNITPNGAMGGNVTIQISALDGADVMKVLHGRRREITDLVRGTQLAYNQR